MTTLQQLQARRDLYAAAEAKILLSQEYQVGEGGTHRRSRRADLVDVQRLIAELDRQIAAASGGRRAYRLVPGCR